MYEIVVIYLDKSWKKYEAGNYMICAQIIKALLSQSSENIFKIEIEYNYEEDEDE